MGFLIIVLKEVRAAVLKPPAPDLTRAWGVPRLASAFKWRFEQVRCKGMRLAPVIEPHAFPDCP
ncbi:hypothetical protein [Paraburkholderia lycopersici]|uniref:hypothetical protein n=1 Tax=Paraburkholderia lycopersici TaxID=416944 RepID=UPI000B8965BF|nr:hypothetical protein [Paraburkholderia lycopersici]